MATLTCQDDFLTLSDVILRPDPGRTIIRPFEPQDPAEYANQALSRPQRIVERALGVPEARLGHAMQELRDAMAGRLRDPESYLLDRFEELNGVQFNIDGISIDRKQLIAAFFCAEYSHEAAALFNPSMIPNLAAPALPDARAQFVMSLRGVGEGHVSSVTFRTGRWGADSGFEIDSPGDKGSLLRLESMKGSGADQVAHMVAAEGTSISDLVIFPTTPSQRQGIEDMRLVVFDDEDHGPQLYGTYTAFDGANARPEMMHRAAGNELSFRALTGRYATGKGMALFPRKVAGHYMMLSRQDNENVWLLWSDDPYSWDQGVKLLEPAEPWEFVQLGNCGSPMEIDEGWLVLTHAVGVVRTYTMGACLLDKRDPSKVIARLKEPLLRPSDVGGRDGYVPNVVYSCGGMVHGRTLLLPFAVGDSVTRFASVALDPLLSKMR